MAAEQVRIFLWAPPRSRSTAFMRAISNKPKTKVLLEPFYRAYSMGSERESKRMSREPIRENCTFLDIKSLCEKDYSGYEVVFVKDIAYYLRGRLSQTYLPEGYIHTFLIRNPRETVASKYKIITEQKAKGFDYFDPAEVGFKELWEMYEFVTEHLGQDPVIVDSGELLRDPEKMLRAYCNRVGMVFDHRMLHWSDEAEDLQTFVEDEGFIPFFRNLFMHQTFELYCPTDQPDLPRVYQDAIDENVPYYEKLYQHRIKLTEL